MHILMVHRGTPVYTTVPLGCPSYLPTGLCFHPCSAPSRRAGAMVVLRAGLCPGLTEEMIQLLRANNIRTGNLVGDVGSCPFGVSAHSTLLVSVSFVVVDFVSSDLEDVAQNCSLSYKVPGYP